MAGTVRLADLTARERDNLLLTTVGALQRVLAAVRENTEPGWRVRREVERIVDEAQDRRPFTVAFERGIEIAHDERRVERNAERWDRWGGRS